jgi:hypothetical protein
MLKNKTFNISVIFKGSLILGLVILMLSSCEKDEELPSINYFHLNNSSDTVTFQFDDTVNIAFEASDNQNLDGYRLSLINNFSFTAAKSNSLLNDITIGKFENPLTDSVVLAKILIDSNLAGPYFATLEVNDLEGNVTELLSRNFVISRPDAPTLNLTNIDNNPITINSTDSLTVEGTLNDDLDLISFQIKISNKKSLESILSKTYSYTEVETTIALSGENLIKIGLNEVETGNYHIFFIVKDNTGNISFLQNELIVN